ncbi:MAG: hypothetical protein ACK5RJ_03230 [Burkholderiales bacterium]|jgi:hypothetical protein|nr:hypothetical protein [Rhodocyclaceae bacterium]MCA3017973.1 hypothetical protein [Rhodocyclaceae bacterium]MCA3021321.1 hypothetical protein [Rhodocyclaceae bacterium]MCA3025824.1 hypothetical protein [Rhodocyclaceae bacterium]MCA3032619.1 hypothetical protein [Rhodocyclaceae bacterium]
MKPRAVVWKPLLLICVVASPLMGCASDDIISWEDYKNVRHEVPYVLEFESQGGKLLYFGAAHSNDANHPQFKRIKACWNHLNPELALLEGGVPPPPADPTSAIQRNGEAGYVRHLAEESKTTALPLERGIDAEAKALTTRFSLEQLRLFYTLRQLQQVKREANPAIGNDWNGWANWWLGDKGFFNFIPVLKDASPKNAVELAEMTKQYFPSLKAWHDISPSEFDPRNNISITQQIARATGELREPLIVARLAEQVAAKKRVFAIVGASHVVVQEPALRAKLGPPRLRIC